MYVIQKCAMSIDGFIDDSSSERLILSNQEDFEYVDEVRSRCDAILVGAGTIRSDNPRLRIRDTQRQERRVEESKPMHPMKVTLTASGNLDANARFFESDGSLKLVYTIGRVRDRLAESLGQKAEIVALGEDTVDLEELFNDLSSKGIERLLVEGGTDIHTQCLEKGLAHELQISLAPFFVGDSKAPKFVRPSSFPYTKAHPMELKEIIQFGNIALLRYLLTNGPLSESPAK